MINQLVIGSQDLHGGREVEGGSHPHVQVALGRTGDAATAEPRAGARGGTVRPAPVAL